MTRQSVDLEQTIGTTVERVKRNERSRRARTRNVNFDLGMMKSSYATAEQPHLSFPPRIASLAIPANALTISENI